ncbi:MAG: rhodanese-like domain-containing protein [Synechococcus sp. ELA619]
MYVSDGLGGDVDDVRWMGVHKALALHLQKRAIFIDCREHADYARGGIPGAWHLPMSAVMDNGIVPRNGPSCPLVVPSEVSFLQPKRLRPDEVKAKNAAGCLSAADAIYRADGCPLKLCPNPQWQGL